MHNPHRIGTTELAVHPIGYGAMHLSIDRTRRPLAADSIRLIQHAVDELGVNFIDTADAYCIDDTETGHNERIIAEALRDAGRRQQVIVATKGGSIRPEGRWERNGRPEHLRTACERSLRALETEIIDLYQLHAPDPTVPVEESVGALRDLQREGKIKHIGVSNVGVPLLERAMRESEIATVQNQFSVINQRDEAEVLKFCEANNITYIPWNPVGGRGKAPQLAEISALLSEIALAHSTTPHVVAIAWLLQLSPAMLPIPGTTKIEHLRQNMEAATLKLTEEEMASFEC
ncbi:MAG: aldo/keto reductase [Armatimonadetes bacterium]|nr:aldo/keto reductase [Armatimonadota bacterium]